MPYITLNSAEPGIRDSPLCGFAAWLAPEQGGSAADPGDGAGYKVAP